jgi:predicted RNA binding protein YcfA (HicA-like mRNA interferase family)
MSVKRADLIRYLKSKGYAVLRQGKKHTIYYNGEKTIPVKRHSLFDRITANEICKQAGLQPKF